MRLALLAMAHVAGGCLLYRGRQLRLAPVLQSDLIVFLLPALLAFIGYSLMVGISFGRSETIGEKLKSAAALGVFLSLFSTAGAAWFAFAYFGT